jgi:DNA-binding transcriptional ArsR family regulator
MFIRGHSTSLKPMKKKLLLSGEPPIYEAKDVGVFDRPEQMKTLVNGLSWQILRLIVENEMYPIQIAKKLGVHEQKVYYHVRKLAEAGIIKIVKEEEKKGATARFYKAAFPAFGVELPYGGRTITALGSPEMDEKLKDFFVPFMNDGVFNGKIVVGSPDPHGPFKARARDGHYAAYLSLFLGRYVELPDDFVVKLDVDVKVEKEEKNNLILVGGPGTNLLTQEVNEHLPLHFSVKSTEEGFLFGGLASQKTGTVYTSDNVGLIAKIINPWDNTRRVIVVAGNKAVGTKACVLALSKFWKETLGNFVENNDFAAVIQGFDMDGDGKVDAIEVLE